MAASPERSAYGSRTGREQCQGSRLGHGLAIVVTIPNWFGRTQRRNHFARDACLGVRGAKHAQSRHERNCYEYLPHKVPSFRWSPDRFDGDTVQEPGQKLMRRLGGLYGLSRRQNERRL